MVMRNDEGKGLVISPWDDEWSATASVESGHYSESLAQLVRFMRQPPGREHYEVVRSQTPRIAVPI
jgi:hypothetical protein